MQYQHILNAIQNRERQLAVLIDPDKMKHENLSSFIKKLNASIATHIFVGGSTVDNHLSEQLVILIKERTKLPVILFPGDITQITEKADALLFLSLISGTNSEYLIGKQIDAVSTLRTMQLEVIPTGYILIENGKETSVQKVTQTIPLSRANIQRIVDIAKAGELLGMKLIYLEAGSGALHPISNQIINAVKHELQIPLIVGGGIKNKQQLEAAYDAGADIVVIGNAFENDDTFFNQLV